MGDSLIKGDRTIPVSRLLAKMVGANAAMLLQQVHFWVQTTENVREGQRWCYNTQPVWAEQLGCSAITVRRAIKALEERGFLVVRCFNKRSYDQTRWYRIDYEKLAEAVSKETGLMCSQRSDGSVQCDHIDVIKVIVPIPEMNYSKINTEMSSDEGKPSSPATAAQVMQAWKAGKEEKKKSPAGQLNVTGHGISALHLLWLKRLSLLNPGITPKPLTKAEVGSFKHVIAALGSEQAKATLDWCLMNWSKFVLNVQAKKGVSGLPSEPVAGFFVKYYDVGVQLLAQSIAPAKPSHSYNLNTPSPTSVMPKSNETQPEDLVTPEEITAALKLFDKGKT